MKVTAGLGVLLWSSPVVADEIWLKNGQKTEGVIKSTDGKTITVESQNGGQTEQLFYPMALVDKLRFVDSEPIARLLSSADTKDLPALSELWDSRRPFLAWPESNAGDVGLAYARLLLAKDTKKAAEEVLGVCPLVESQDWQAARKVEATRLRLSALARLGKADQALAEAEKMQQVSGADEASLASMQVQARFVQAEAAWAKLQELETEWPKWKLMQDKRVERRRFLDAALDGFVFPAVFHPELKKLCAEGLCRAAEISCATGDPDYAATCAGEIINYFPEPEFKTRAEKLVKEYKLAPSPADAGKKEEKS